MHQILRKILSGRHFFTLFVTQSLNNTQDVTVFHSLSRKCHWCSGTFYGSDHTVPTSPVAAVLDEWCCSASINGVSYHWLVLVTPGYFVQILKRMHNLSQDFNCVELRVGICWIWRRGFGKVRIGGEGRRLNPNNQSLKKNSISSKQGYFYSPSYWTGQVQLCEGIKLVGHILTVNRKIWKYIFITLKSNTIDVC